MEVGGEKDNKKEEKKTGKIRDNVSNMRESRKQVTPEVLNVYRDLVCILSCGYKK